ncbi:hypothetical protein SAMN04488518_10662 [Pseudovibrio ascidiaceicola]|uniref:Uncharacterized protein n=1 Tax=Pseudovibrio ascidiaceicola TaxID=285279 RepID=A0A1I4A9W7_9HYPH|nr:hypothetical protein SAMN04488518_10662 [Pseudovibrio ascidiaceicola]
MAYPDTFPCPNSSSVFDRHFRKSRFYCRCSWIYHRVIPYSPGPFPSNHAATFEVRFTGPLKGALRLPTAQPSLRQTDGRSASSPLRRHRFRIWEENTRGISFSASAHHRHALPSRGPYDNCDIPRVKRCREAFMGPGSSLRTAQDVHGRTWWPLTKKGT